LLKDLLNNHLTLLTKPQLFVPVPYTKQKIYLNYKSLAVGWVPLQNHLQISFLILNINFSQIMPVFVLVLICCSLSFV